MPILLDYVLSNVTIFILIMSGVVIGWVARGFPEQQRRRL